MSEHATVVTEAHVRYIAARTTQEDAFLGELRTAAHAAGIPPISICFEQSVFMGILLRLRGAREVVEVGTLAGYSAIAMARALPAGGRVRTIEYEPVHADFARKWAAKSDVAAKVDVYTGAGVDVLKTFADHSADAAFLDADKGSYQQYVRACERILRPGGLLMVDNAFAFGQLFDTHPTDREAPAVKAFNDWLPTTGAFTSIIVPFGDGCWVGVKN